MYLQFCKYVEDLVIIEADQRLAGVVLKDGGIYTSRECLKQ